MYLSSIIVALTTAVLSSAACVRRQEPQTPLLTIEGAWFEGISVRENGTLVVNRLDVPELWTINPLTKESNKVLSIPNVLGLTGITEIEHDVFAFVAGNFSTADFTVEAGTWSVWKVDLSAEEPEAELIADVPDAGFLLGTATFDRDAILVADAAQGKVLKIAVSTGKYTVIIEDGLLTPAADADIPEAIHGIRYHGEEIYYTNTFGNSFGRFPIDASTAEVGNITTVANLTSPLDLAVDGDGNAYIGQIGEGIVKVSRNGTVTPAWNVTSATSLAFGRTKEDSDILYAGTAVGELYALKIE
ncbi:hypothetical protein jhhlp_007757 [Lomentospora prolificans]|uniref:SMP-30/Gluconolactonase/LRE-like region domain-containing protein n=1 Tax=Lomentospora prolificans TaxID=41688 RepID=A0A2N3N0H0_9PEZI|nr:hypothetical protein jhhlp_007757 [Lomentospora prolificans]